MVRGEKTVVAPVVRKIPPKGSKARVHYLLKKDRPAFITILSLVRDAAWYLYYLYLLSFHKILKNYFILKFLNILVITIIYLNS